MLLYTAMALKFCGKTKIKHLIAAGLLLAFIVLTLAWKFFGTSWEPEMICYEDFYSGDGSIMCRPRCKKGYFSLPWMEKCHKNLACRDIHSHHFEIIEHLGNGAVKSVHLAKWNGYEVALNSLINRHVGEDFKHGLAMLNQFTGSPFTTQLLGYCKQSYVTEYHPFGDASQFNKLLLNEKFQVLRDSPKARFGFCVNYVQILNFLHARPEGSYVMCDSNDLRKLLQQFLIRSDFQLLANDLDALPLANTAKNRTIKCGHRIIQGDFPAPEQKWKHDYDFIDDLMPGYDEKTDIWKIPDVCEFFLGSVTPGIDALKFHLAKIHETCKNEDPNSRPSANEVMQVYRRVYDML